jgi:hypothetical protein
MSAGDSACSSSVCLSRNKAHSVASREERQRAREREREREGEGEGERERERKSEKKKESASSRACAREIKGGQKRGKDRANKQEDRHDKERRDL